MKNDGKNGKNFHYLLLELEQLLLVDRKKGMKSFGNEKREKQQ